MTDFSTGGALGGLDLNSTDNVGVITKRLDFSKVNAAAATAHKVFNVPKNCRVRNVVAEVLTAEGAVATLTIGSSANPDGYVVLVDANAVATTGNTDNAAETDINLLVSAANGIYFTSSLLLDAAVIRFSAEIVAFNFTESLSQ